MIKAIENEAIQASLSQRPVPSFRAGDTVRVGVKIKDGATERVQFYQGTCIAISRKGLGSNFTVRKTSDGVGVERVFPFYAPVIDSIEVVKRGVVRRAKLYYLRKLRGKAVKIEERIDFSAAS